MKFCIDCGKELNKLSKYSGTKRCCSCAAKDRLTHRNMLGKNNPNYGHKYNFKGRKNPNYKGGFSKCADCQKQLKSYKSIRCYSCESKRRHKIGILNSKGKNNPMFGKIVHSKYIKYKNIYFHSSWEVKYAQYLDKQNIKWLYEFKTFNLDNTTYTPDFFLPHLNEYIEIKGYWRADAKDKFRRFKKKFPDIKIIILNKSKLLKKGVL